MKKLALDYIVKNTVMALEIETDSGYRCWEYGTAEQLKPKMDLAEKLYGGISDYCDATARMQPDDLKDFHEKWFAHICKNGYMEIEKFYEIYYNEAA